MTQSIVPLDRSKHGKLTFTPSEDFGFTAEMNAVPLFGLEVVDAAGSLPVVFLPGSLLPHALLGLGQSNVFLDGKRRWTAGYMPLYISNYPFSLAQVDKREKADDPQVVLAIDEDAPHFKGKKGAPMYDKDGKLAAFADKAREALARQRLEYEKTVAAMRELDQLDLIVEKSVTVRYKGKNSAVSGLRVVDREKVMALPDETLAIWARNGLLEFLFAHWQSLKNLQKLLTALPDDTDAEGVKQ